MSEEHAVAEIQVEWNEFLMKFEQGHESAKQRIQKVREMVVNV